MNSSRINIYRPYRSDADYWCMSEFLRRVFVRNNRLERSWQVARLDCARWHSCLNCARVGLEEVAILREDGDQLVAFLMPDGGRGEAHFCVPPGLRTLELEKQMLQIAEECL